MFGDIVDSVTGSVTGGGEEKGGGTDWGAIISELFLRGTVILVGIVFLWGGVSLLGRQKA